MRWLAAVAALGLGLPASAAAEEPVNPEIAVSNGTAHFAWEWKEGTGMGVQERFRAPGGEYSERQWASAASQGTVSRKLAVDPGGNAAIVWVTTGATAGQVRLRPREADGTLRPIQTLSATGLQATSVDVAVDPDGNQSFAWVGKQDGGGGTPVVQYRRRTAGGALGPAMTISTAGAVVRAPRVAVDGAGNAIVAWEHESGGVTTIRSRRRAADGSWGLQQTLSFGNGSSSGVDLGFDRNGNAVFAWLFDAGTSSGVHVRRRAANGTLGQIKAISEQVADNATGRLFDNQRIAVAPGGGAVVTWTRRDAEGDQIVEARRRDPAGGFSPIATISALIGSSYSPRVAVDPNGHATISWDAYIGGGTYAAFARRRALDGTLGPRHELSARSIEVVGTNVAVDAEGNAIVGWGGATDAGLLFQARTLTPAGALGDIETIAAG